MAYLKETQSVEEHTSEMVNEQNKAASRPSLSSRIGANTDVDFETLVGQTQAAAPSSLDTLLFDGPSTNMDMPSLLDSMAKPASAASTPALVPSPAMSPRPSLQAPRATPSLAPPPRPAMTMSQPTTPAATSTSTGLFDALVSDPVPSKAPAMLTLSAPPLQPTRATVHTAKPSAPPGWSGGMLQPQAPSTSSASVPSKSTWADFDPLK